MVIFTDEGGFYLTVKTEMFCWDEMKFFTENKRWHKDIGNYFG